jgi:hypothetical protein
MQGSTWTALSMRKTGRTDWDIVLGVICLYYLLAEIISGCDITFVRGFIKRKFIRSPREAKAILTCLRCVFATGVSGSERWVINPTWRYKR